MSNEMSLRKMQQREDELINVAENFLNEIEVHLEMINLASKHINTIKNLYDDKYSIDLTEDTKDAISENMQVQIDNLSWLEPNHKFKNIEIHKNY